MRPLRFIFIWFFSRTAEKETLMEKDLSRKRCVCVSVCVYVKRFEAIIAASISMFFDYYIFNVIAIFMNIINFFLIYNITLNRDIHYVCVCERRNICLDFRYMAYVPSIFIFVIPSSQR